jgi:hypothetical protein
MSVSYLSRHAVPLRSGSLHVILTGSPALKSRSMHAERLDGFWQGEKECSDADSATLRAPGDATPKRGK